jgi:hypothetical protein
MVHNGCISNDKDLKEEHEKLGIKYSTIEGDKFNDSESLMHELIMVIEGIKKPEEFGARGSMAFIMLQTDKNNKAKSLYYGRYSSPLILTQLEGLMVLRSEAPQGDSIQENKLFKYDYNTKETTSEDVKFGHIYLSSLRRSLDIKTDESTMAYSITKFADGLRVIYDNKLLQTYDIKGLKEEEIDLILIVARKVKKEIQLKWESIVMSNEHESERIWVEIDFAHAVENIITLEDYLTRDLMITE